MKNSVIKTLVSKLGKKNKGYSDQNKLQRNIEAAEERLADPNLTMCQRQEYEKTLEHLRRDIKK